MSENIENNKKVLYFDAENEALVESIEEIKNSEHGTFNYDGRRYVNVAQRISVLRKKMGFNVSVQTEILKITEKDALVKASIFVYKNDNWHLIATGHSEERRNDSEINKAALIENTETSAIGRALATLGLVGDEFASSEEMVKAVTQLSSQNGKDTNQKGSKVKEIIPKESLASENQINYLTKLISETNTDRENLMKHYGVTKIELMSKVNIADAIRILRSRKESGVNKNVMDNISKPEGKETQGNNGVKYTSIHSQNQEQKEHVKTLAEKMTMANETNVKVVQDEKSSVSEQEIKDLNTDQNLNVESKDTETNKIVDEGKTDSLKSDKLVESTKNDDKKEVEKIDDKKTIENEKEVNKDKLVVKEEAVISETKTNDTIENVKKEAVISETKTNDTIENVKKEESKEKTEPKQVKGQRGRKKGSGKQKNQSVQEARLEEQEKEREERLTQKKDDDLSEDEEILL